MIFRIFYIALGVIIMVFAGDLKAQKQNTAKNRPQTKTEQKKPEEKREKPDGYRSLTLRTGYANSMVTNYTIGRFNLEMSMPFDKLGEIAGNVTDSEENNKLLRIMVIVFLPPMLFKMNDTTRIAYHEFGHGTRFRAYGDEPVYVINSIEESLVEQEVNRQLKNKGFKGNYSINKRHTGYFSYWNDVYAKGLESGEGYTTQKYIYQSPYVYYSSFDWSVDRDEKFIITAGGMNNEMYQSQLIEEQGYLYGYNFYHAFLHADMKTPWIHYADAVNENPFAFQDINNLRYDTTYVLNQYNEGRDFSGNNLLRDYYGLPRELNGVPLLFWGLLVKGPVTPITASQLVFDVMEDKYYHKRSYGITDDDLRHGNDNSVTYSATTYMMFYSIYKYYKTGDAKVMSMEYKGVKIPDVNFYLNRNGISYNVSTGYRLNKKWLFPVSYEWIKKGDFQHELNVGAQFRSEKYILYGWVLAGLSTGGGMQIDFFPDILFDNKYNGSVRLKTGLRLEYHAMNTLAGERNISYALKGNHALDADLFVSMVY